MLYIQLDSTLQLEKGAKQAIPRDKIIDRSIFDEFDVVYYI